MIEDLRRITFTVWSTQTIGRFLDYMVIILKSELNGEIWYCLTIAIITTTNSNDNLTSRGIRNGVPRLQGSMGRYRTAPLSGLKYKNVLQIY